MFAPFQPTNKRRPGLLAVSITLHCLLLYVLVRPAQPIFVTPSSVMQGNYGTSTQLIYLGKPGFEDREGATQRVTLNLPRLKQRARKAAASNHDMESKAKQAAVQAPRAGTPFGALLHGPASGHDVRPTLPVVFPDPVVARSELPAGAQGTVIVEITIDEKGNVVATKVLQDAGLGVEERVLAALRQWRFRPATIDGVAIASQQDVYFHFPS